MSNVLHNPSFTESTTGWDDRLDIPVGVQQRRKFSLTQRQADLITAVSNVIFAVALLPTVLAGTILPVATTLATLVALLMLGVVLLHFRLWWGFAWNCGCASMWLILLVIAL